MQLDTGTLCGYRLERAKEDLQAARVNHESGLFKASVNRSYYAIFHGIRAVNILDGFDASKHSSVSHILISISCILANLRGACIRLSMEYTAFVKNRIIRIFLWYQKGTLPFSWNMRKHLSKRWKSMFERKIYGYDTMK